MTQISSPDKVMFPDEGITKADVVGYYERVGERMLPHVEGRPLTLHRFPRGIGAKGFLQKNAADHFPDSMERVEVPKREGGSTTYVVADRPEHLPYLANQNTITFHVFTSRLPRVDVPDRIVFDLDPSTDDLGRLHDAVEAVGAWLDEIGLGRGTPMTTGSGGYHVVVPVKGATHIDDVGTFTHRAAVLLAHRHPDLLTAEFRIAERGDRVFVDWLRNRFAQTGVAAWSLRAREGAPVAMPIEWGEIRDTHPRSWTLRDAADRIDHPDPILAVDPVDPSPAIERTEALLDESAITVEPFDRFRS